MKNLKQLLVSGLIGVGIGMSWLAVEILGMYYSENLAKSTINVSTFLFWVLASFLIGVFFFLAGLVFNNDSWSLRKQIFIICKFILNFYSIFILWTISSIH